MTCILIIFLAVIIPVPLSIIIEALRVTPGTPDKLYWSNDIEIQYRYIEGDNIRYIKTGQGPDLVLLHTLRTQLDIFQRIIPELAKTHTVYALDYPGHGFSDIPEQDYVPEMFLNSVEQFMEQMDITNATLAGLSIGANLVLMTAAKKNPRVKQVIAINPYDGKHGRTIERSSLVAKIMFSVARIPVLGETFMRFRMAFVEKLIMLGGVSSPDSLPEELLKILYAAGQRKGHYRAFINLIRHFPEWERSRAAYENIDIPVKLIYGEADWSNHAERERNKSAISNVEYSVVPGGGHFLSLDKPDELIRLINS